MMEKVEAAPKIIPDLKPSNSKAMERFLDPILNNQWYEKIQKSAKHYPTVDIASTRKYPHLELKRIGDDTFLGLNHTKSEVVYYMHYTQESFFGKTAVYQDLIIRDVQNSQARGFAEEVMLDVLIPEFGVIITDKLHTTAGKRMWQAVLGIAESKGLQIGWLDKNKKQLHIFKEAREAVTKEETIWGPNDFHKNIRLFISKEPLKGSSKYPLIESILNRPIE